MRFLNNDMNIETTRGDTLSFGVQIYDIGQSLNTAYFTVKNNYDDEIPVFQKSIDSGIELDHIDGQDYYYKVRIDPEDTKDLEAKKYYYDFEIGVNNDIFTIMKGILDLEFDTTKGGI